MNKLSWIIKSIAVLLALVIYTLFDTWKVGFNHTDMYGSFLQQFSSNMIHNLTLFLLIGILSSWADELLSITKSRRIVQTMIKLVIYTVIGVVCGVIFSLIQHQSEFIGYFIQQSTIASIVLFIVQTMIEWILRIQSKE